MCVFLHQKPVLAVWLELVEQRTSIDCGPFQPLSVLQEMCA